MIYNWRLHLLFVHIQKTGGTSIHQALLAERGSREIRPAHLRLCDVRLPWPRPRIVAVVRNPWERLVSWYRMMLRKGVHNDFSAFLLMTDPAAGTSGRPASFSTFIRRCAPIIETQARELSQPPRSFLCRVRRNKGLPHLKSLGWNHEDYLTIAGHYLADDVLRFEQLEDDWAALGQRLRPGRGWSVPLPRANAAPTKVDWRSFYRDERDIAFVEQQYARDIARYGFAFDG